MSYEHDLYKKVDEITMNNIKDLNDSIFETGYEGVFGFVNVN